MLFPDLPKGTPPHSQAFPVATPRRLPQHGVEEEFAMSDDEGAHPAKRGKKGGAPARPKGSKKRRPNPSGVGAAPNAQTMFSNLGIQSAVCECFYSIISSEIEIRQMH